MPWRRRPRSPLPAARARGRASNHPDLTPTLTVTPGQDLTPEGDTVLTLTGEGYGTTNDFGANFGGAYLLFGVVSLKDADDPGSWAPTKRGVSGVNYDYAAGAGVYQSLINYPGNETEPGLDFMDADGNWETTLTIPGAQFTSQAGNEIDCLDAETICGVITFGAHGQQSKGTEVFTPVTFAEEEPDAVAPAFTTQPEDVTVDEGADAAFSVAVSGEPEPTLQWQTRTDADGEWKDVADATSSELAVEAVAAEDDGSQYRALASNDAADDVASDAATLSVTAAAGPEYPDGAAVGTPLEGTDAHIAVTPGEELDGSGAVELTLNGYGFDPGPAVEAGTGSGGVYVGFGTKADPDSAEEWRRSKGGSSGPVGQADYTYGAPIFVANQGTGDAEVADGVMAADGTWTATLTIPGSSIPSFFGDTIDCLEHACGVFSFGAHGMVSAANEAYTAVSFAEPVVPAVETTTTLAPQDTSTGPAIVGDEVELTATVQPADATGAVEFFRGETSIGTGEVVDGAASVTTADVAGGAQQLSAAFVPEDEAAFEPSQSAERTYRFVDLEPAVGTIEVGEAVEQIQDATLGWSIANFISFGSGPGKSVVSGDVALEELPADPTVDDRANREFVFSGGEGVVDAAGSSSVAYTGEVEVSSGTANQWTFADPEVFRDAEGDGYITADVTAAFLGSLLGVEDDIRGPERVVVSTFTGAETGVEDGVTSFQVAPTFEDQFAAGTWAADYTGGTFSNQTLAMINDSVRLFFLQTGSGSDVTKAGRDISVSYTAGTAPTITGQPSDLEATEGDDVSFAVEAAGAPEPTVQWQSEAGDEWADIDGATGAELALSDVTVEAHGTQYRAVVSNAFGEVASDEAALSVAPVEPTDEPEAPAIDGEETGGFELVGIDGREVTVAVPDAYENTWLGAHLHSAPQFLGWSLARDGRVVVTVPADAYGAHHLSFVSTDGDLLGTLAVTLADAPSDGGDDGDGTDGGSGDGGETGTGSGDDGSGDSGTAGGGSGDAGAGSGGAETADAGSDDTGAGDAGTADAGASADGLPATGSELPLFAGGAGLLLLLAGAALLAARARRQAAAQ